MIVLEQAKSLLDFNQRLDISLLDSVVNLMYTEHGDVVSAVPSRAGHSLDHPFMNF